MIPEINPNTFERLALKLTHFTVPYSSAYFPKGMSSWQQEQYRTSNVIVCHVLTIYDRIHIVIQCDNIFYDVGSLIPNTDFIEDLKKFLKKLTPAVHYQECLRFLISITYADTIDEFMGTDSSYSNFIKERYEVTLAQCSFSNQFAPSYRGELLDEIPIVDVIGEKFNIILIHSTGAWKLIIGNNYSSTFITSPTLLKNLWYDYPSNEAALMLSYKAVKDLQ